MNIANYIKNLLLSASTVACVAIVSASPSFAQSPSWAKKATKSVFTLKTFTADGQLVGSGSGFFTDGSGVGISSFGPFKGADRAVVIDASGKEFAVLELLGADDTYDVARFRIDAKKVNAFSLASPEPSVGNVWVLPYKSGTAWGGVVRRIEKFHGGYDYFTVSMKLPESAVGAPLLNDGGEVLAVVGQPSSTTDTVCYAVSAIFADSLHVTGLSLSDPSLKLTNIKKALPEDEQQAVLALFMGGASLDSVRYASLIDDFIEKFPKSPTGYVSRAQQYARQGNLPLADADIERALKTGVAEDDTHYSYSRMIYNRLLAVEDSVSGIWTLGKALQEIASATSIRPLPLYLQHEARLRFSMRDYAAAADCYERLSSTNLRSPDMFYEQSRCHLMLGDSAKSLALLDSAVAEFSTPLLREAAPYIFARARARHEMGLFRAAVADYNEYADLIKTGLSANFYYYRQQAEVGGRLYQQALDDLDKAISLEPDDELLHAEKASLLVRVGRYEDALAEGRECIRISPESSDGYLFIGLSQCLLGKKDDGLLQLKKARQLGHPQAAGLIERYSK